MLLIHKDISHMPITELENDSESVWVKVFANKTSHFVASWYRPPGGDLEKLDSQLKSLILLMFMLTNSNPVINLFYLNQFERLLSHYHLPMDQTYFHFPSLIDLRKMSLKS